MINKVEIAGVDTSKLPILSNKEKEELLEEIKKGNKKAREKFIQCNLRLVLSIVQRFGGRRRNSRRFISNWMYWINKSYR